MPQADDADPIVEPIGSGLDIRPRSWVKRILPRSMFGRSLLIIVTPLLIAQIIATWVFYDRHWETVSRRLSADVAGDVAMLIEAMQYADNQVELTRLMERATGFTELSFTLNRAAQLPPPAPSSGTSLEQQLRVALTQRLGLPFRIDAVSEPRDILIMVQLADGVLTVTAPQKRLYTSTTYIFIFWMLGSSVVLLGVAVVFLRNQVKSLRRLAAAAEGFGKGRPIPSFKVEGASEVRQAAVAFLQMRDRIQRQIRQRTEMLAGVSHDLRTPLTRMKLALEFLGKDRGGDAASAAELRSDVAEMEQMVNGYLEFARGEGAEAAVATNLTLLLEDVAAAMRRDGTPIALDLPPEHVMPVRPNALRRCVANLLANARRYGGRVWLTGTPRPDGIDILVDDDGPGIPAADRDRVFRPFIRLDASRNAATGGVGLGLTIARDVARSHGGDVRLETSPQGGLRARLHLPR
ncbi:MAG: HAMP domain-containing protein [Alphaproteobacteria bacterium]|nr:HAMP domain-containing protein [Alphaproteobacteria bacterium]